MFGKIKENLNEVQAQTRDFVESNLEYYKLWVFKVVTKSASSLLKIILIGVFLLMVVVFFSIAGALAIGYALDNFVYGFLIVGGIYLILSIIVYNLKNRIEEPIIKAFSDIFYNEEY